MTARATPSRASPPRMIPMVRLTISGGVSCWLTTTHGIGAPFENVVNTLKTIRVICAPLRQNDCGYRTMECCTTDYCKHRVIRKQSSASTVFALHRVGHLN